VVADLTPNFPFFESGGFPTTGGLAFTLAQIVPDEQEIVPKEKL